MLVLPQTQLFLSKMEQFSSVPIPAPKMPWTEFKERLINDFGFAGIAA
jgi:hypothetical protein